MLGHRTLNAEDYLLILKRRWWIVVIPMLLLPIAAYVLTFFVTPRYDSTSLVLIDQQKVSSEVVKPLDIGGLTQQLGLITAQIESRATLEPIIRKYNLYANQHLSMDARLEKFSNTATGLNIAPIESQIDRGNGLPGFKITFTADDPQTAQQVCAEITGLYTQNSLLNHQNMTASTKQFLNTELAEQQRKLNDMGQKKAEFEQKYMGSLPGDAGNTSNMLSSLSSRLDAVNQQITQLEQQKQVQQLGLNQAMAVAVPAVVAARTEQTDETELAKAEADLSSLQLHYTDDYPDVKAAKRRVADLKAQVAKANAEPAPAPAVPAPNRADSPEVTRLKVGMNLIEQNIAEKTKEQQQLQAQMHSVEGRLAASPEVEEQYTELTRDYNTESATYNRLLAQSDQSGMATEMENLQQGETFTILDAASLPIDPTFPKPSIFIFGGLGAGLALGLCIVGAMEYRDTALRNERDIWAFTQLPTLAVLAYSDAVAEGHPVKFGLLKRLFTRKAPQEQLAG